MFTRPNEPIAPNHKIAASDLFQSYICSSADLSSVFVQSALESSVQCLTSINNLPMTVEGVNALMWSGNVNFESMLRTVLEFQNELMSERSIELKKEIVIFAHSIERWRLTASLRWMRPYAPNAPERHFQSVSCSRSTVP